MARDLNVTDWAVLALVAEAPTHGFAIARDLEQHGAVGAIWTARRPLVYRALETLERAGLIEDGGTEASESGPPRRLVCATDEGAARVREWLSEPIAHFRDARSLLLLKLLFLDRSDGDPEPLITAQLERFEEQLSGLVARHEEAVGFDRTALAWRVSSARAAIDFLNSLDRGPTRSTPLGG